MAFDCDRVLLTKEYSIAHSFDKLVVIGASLGGLSAMREIVSGLKADFPAPIVFVMHLARNAESAMDRILQQHCVLKVKSAEDGDVLEAGSIYLAPPGCDVFFERGRLKLEKSANVPAFSPSIDRTLSSAAEHYGSRLIAVQLTGNLDDGVEGLNAVFDQGGQSIVQTPADAVAPSMPRNAIARDHPTFVCPLDQVSRLLIELTQASPKN